MTRVYIFCEGQTEETFVREILYNHFFDQNIILNPIIISTSKKGKGGVSSYGKIKCQIEKKCKEDKTSWVTTMFDFYAFPKDIPNLNINSGVSSIDKLRAINDAFERDINQPRFIPNLIIHEFEGLLFSSPQAFSEWFDKPNVVDELIAVRKQFSTPEHINDDFITAPSKRILNICKGYEKVSHGSLIALDIGLDRIRSECPIFNQWIERIEGLSCK